jgi:single-stranded-DNA-specific exonuclease
MIEKQWIYEKADEAIIENLQEALQVHPIFCKLLAQRGIETYEEAKLFFRPSLTHLHDPFLMLGMEKAVLRLEKAIENQEKILLYGDYDVDGTTSVALMYSFLKKHHEQLEYYIPHRYKEGYGISYQGIDYAAENDFTLVIAMDCGITAVEKIAYANTKKVDFIICDHHLPKAEIPDAVAVLDPKQSDCNYPYKELSGCGVAFKLVQAYAEKNDLDFTEVTDLLDLLMVSIACDIVPITGENRVLTYFGLERLNNYAREGLRALISIANKNYPLTISDIVFGIGPMINAAGRLSDAKNAVKLLLAEDATEAREDAEKLKHENVKRRTFEKDITVEALTAFRAVPNYKDLKAVVLYGENWHKGVIGIVASRMVETFHRPTIILARSDDKIVGSARSVRGFDIHEAIKQCEDLLINFGGHQYAAGLTLPIENLEKFKARFEKIVAESITVEQLIPKMKVNADLDFKYLEYERFWKILSQFAPFGPQNRRPVFRTSNVTDAGGTRLLKDVHLKLKLKQTNTDSKIIQDAIAFNMGDYFELIKSKQPFELCYTIEENNWRGRKNLQLNVKDLKFYENKEVTKE